MTTLLPCSPTHAGLAHAAWIPTLVIWHADHHFPRGEQTSAIHGGAVE